MKQLIISIGREYGSGGHEIGRKLAEKLNLDFYDRNLLDEIAHIKNSDAELLKKYDEAPKKRFFSRTVRGYSNSPEENVAELQFALLKHKAADEDSFVIVGRCTDEIFKDLANYISIFVTADEDKKVERVMKYRNMSEKQARKTIERHDKTRRAYHDHFCKAKWGLASTYDLCVNSSVLGIDGTVDFLVNYIQNFCNDNK
ncbi:AAA family ATPase [Treponema sp.]|uniref:cytidylate kinase-like family protein n=1 Tax=Treponema sp. TaxID=166 RepID=UPI0025EE2B5D|nr:cytidylate kinase-like family protein [Treponema sp.]MCR5219239.1 cytidylate kinase-like family protein [Treponema sp.]